MTAGVRRIAWELSEKMVNFSDRLFEAVRRTGTPAMVGIDPQWDLLPETVREQAATSNEESKAIAAFRAFSIGIVDAVCDLVPVVKFQMAFYEALGPTGLPLLAELTRYAKSAGLLVILDGKRSDIGSSAAGYAEAYLGPPPADNSRGWCCDALTVNPYLGLEGLQPFVDAAKANAKGLFVLVRTSNPGAGLLQDLVVEGRTVHDRVADWVEAWAAEDCGENGYGSIGAVVGATVPADLARLRRRMPSAVLLAPGYGAQGGSASDVSHAFDPKGLGAIVNNSRGILYAFRDAKFRGLDWQKAARRATQAMIADLGTQTNAGQIRRAAT